MLANIENKLLRRLAMIALIPVLAAAALLSTPSYLIAPKGAVRRDITETVDAWLDCWNGR